jgi:hypothetical protein
LADEPFDNRVAFPDIYGNHPKSALSEISMEPLHQGHLNLARLTPGCPKVEKDYIPPEITEGNRLSGQAFEFETLSRHGWKT